MSFAVSQVLYSLVHPGTSGTTASGCTLEQLTGGSSSPFQVNLAAFPLCWGMRASKTSALPVLPPLPGTLFLSHGIYILGRFSFFFPGLRIVES